MNIYKINITTCYAVVYYNELLTSDFILRQESRNFQGFAKSSHWQQNNNFSSWGDERKCANANFMGKKDEYFWSFSGGHCAFRGFSQASICSGIYAFF